MYIEYMYIWLSKIFSRCKDLGGGGIPPPGSIGGEGMSPPCPGSGGVVAPVSKGGGGI